MRPIQDRQNSAFYFYISYFRLLIFTPPTNSPVSADPNDGSLPSKLAEVTVRRKYGLLPSGSQTTLTFINPTWSNGD